MARTTELVELSGETRCEVGIRRSLASRCRRLWLWRSRVSFRVVHRDGERVGARTRRSSHDCLGHAAEQHVSNPATAV